LSQPFDVDHEYLINPEANTDLKSGGATPASLAAE
jgi:hypothetical protein